MKQINNLKNLRKDDKKMKSLSNTFLFNLEDKSLDLKKKIQSCTGSTFVIPASKVEDQLNVINKRFNFPYKLRVMTGISNGSIQMLYSNLSQFTLPSFIPTVLNVKDGKVQAMCFLSKYGIKEGKNESFDYLKIDPRTLFAMLQAGSIYLGIYKNFNTVSSNQVINDLGCQMYASLVGKVLDKMYAVNLNPVKADRVRFLLGKFFLINMLERPNNTTTNENAYHCCKNKTNKEQIMAWEKETIHADVAYSDLNNFVLNALNLVDGLEACTVRSLLNNYIQMYGPASTMSLEFFPYFCIMISNVAVGAKINADYLIESVVGKHIDKFYNQLAELTRD